MKKLIYLLFLFLPFFVKGQTDYQSVNKFLVGQNIRPALDTIIPPLWVGEIRTKVSNDTGYLYVCISKTATQKWRKVQGAISLSSGNNINITANPGDTYNIGVVAPSQRIIFGTGTGSTNSSFLTFDESIRRLNVDSIFGRKVRVDTLNSLSRATFIGNGTATQLIMAVQQSGGNLIMGAQNDATWRVGNFVHMYPMSPATRALQVSGPGFRIATNTQTDRGFSTIIASRLTRNTDSTNEATLAGNLLLNENFTVTSGTGQHNQLRISGTIDQSGATGTTRGIWINQNIISAVDYRALDVSNGLVTLNSRSGSTVIGDSSIQSSVKFRVVSTTQASIPNPVMTSAQRIAIVSPIEGSQIYDNTNKSPYYYDGTEWRDLTGGTGWESYTDNGYTVGAPFAIAEGVTDTIDNRGQVKISTQKPLGVDSLYNRTVLSPNSYLSNP